MDEHDIFLRFRTPFIVVGLLTLFMVILIGASNYSLEGYLVPHFAGLIGIIVGLILTLYGFLRRIRSEDVKDLEEVLEGKTLVICPKCEKTNYLREFPEKLCPECSVPIVPLEGFYDKPNQTNT